MALLVEIRHRLDAVGDAEGLQGVVPGEQFLQLLYDRIDRRLILVATNVLRGASFVALYLVGTLEDLGLRWAALTLQFALGLLATLATWLYLREGFIIFGILHLIGVSVMLSVLFFRFGKYNILLGLLCIAGGSVTGSVHGPLWLLPLGITPASFTSVDYTPLIPWFGAVLVGIGGYIRRGSARLHRQRNNYRRQKQLKQVHSQPARYGHDSPWH